MADFTPDPELETKELNATFKTNASRNPRDIYNTWPVWGKNLAKILVGLVIVIVLLLIGRSIHHHTEKHSKTGGAGSSISNKNAGTTSSAAKSGNSGSGSASKTGNNPPKASAPANSTTGKPGEIVNTGPGDVAAVFAVAAVAGTSAHYVISRRRT